MEVFRQTILTPISESLSCFDDATDEFKPTVHDEKVMDFLESIISENFVPLDAHEIQNDTHFITVILYRKNDPTAKPLSV